MGLTISFLAPSLTAFGVPPILLKTLAFSKAMFAVHFASTCVTEFIGSKIS
jgi:hypothetical protein